jgi:gliding motility-associated-like protein
MRVLIAIWIVLFHLSLNVSGQEYSNKGRDFWLAYPAHINGTGSVMGIYITSDQDATVTINAGGTTLPTVQVVRNQVQRVFLGGGGNNPTNTAVYLNSEDGIKSGAAIHIVSDKNIVVFAHIIRSARSGATLVLPTPVLGIEYIVASYGSKTITPQEPQSGKSLFSVVAAQDNTIIEITPAAGKLANPTLGTPERKIGEPYRITLPKAGDCYQFISNQLEDVSGTIIRSVATGNTSCKPIAVFSGSTWATIGCDDPGITPSGGDNLFQEAVPLKSWGKRFVTAPFSGRPSDIYRIYPSKPNTTVTVTENGVTRTLGIGNMVPGKNIYEISSGFPLSINSADNPISVVQYITAQTCKTGCTTNNNAPSSCFTDPEMVILNPVEQTLSKITFFSAHQNYVPANQTNVQLHYLNVIIPKRYFASLRIDQQPPVAIPVDIPGTEYVYIQEDLSGSSLANPVHSIAADSGFAAIVYGYGSVESYGYNAGTNVVDLNQFVSVKNEFSTVNFPATCKESPFNLSITLPYKPLKISWDFKNNADLGSNPGDIVSPDPTGILPDSSFKSAADVNKDLFLYRLKNTDGTAKNFQFTTKGTFPVDVIVVNPSPDGCSGEQIVSYEIQVFDPPVSSATAQTTGCLEEPVIYTSANQTDGRTIQKYLWSVDGAVPDTLTTPIFNHKFAAEGLKKVGVKVITDIGCISPDSVTTVNLSGKPIIDFAVDAIRCLDKPFTVTDKTKPFGTALLSKFLWKFDGASTDTLLESSNPQKTFNKQLVNAKLIVITETGCTDSLGRAITVNPNPVPLFSLPEFCLKDGDAEFISASVISDNRKINKETWEFGDASLPGIRVNPVVGAIIKHPYSSSGEYPVKLEVTSENGCVEDTTAIFTVNGAIPVADFKVVNATGLCSNQEVIIENLSTVDFGQVGKVDISWLDANLLRKDSTDQTPLRNSRYAYRFTDFLNTTQKDVSIRMVAYSGKSCFDDTTVTVKLNGSPQVKLSAIPSVCTEKKPVFIKSGSFTPVVGVGGLATYSGKGIGIDGTYSPYGLDSGAYLIKYRYTTDVGCFAEDSGYIQVNFTPKVDAGADFSLLDDSARQLSATARGVDLRFKWEPSDYLSSDTLLNPIVAFPKDDITYTLIVTGKGECIASDFITITSIQLLDPPNTFTPNGDGKNDTWLIKNIEKYLDCVVEVFTPQGNRVYYSTNGYDKPFDGTFQGKPLPVGTYYYVINPKLGRKPLAGYLTILK